MSDIVTFANGVPFAIAAAVFGYLIGSIPFGLIITRFAGLGDIRAIGSGNIGATNVLRTGRKSLAALTLLLDAAKGAVPVLLLAPLGEAYALVAGFGAFLGHIFPVWLGFKGGKGVATYLGVLAAASWPAALAFALVWLAVAALSRFSSASALAASLVAPAVAWLVTGPAAALAFALLSVILWTRHTGNIGRLLNGTESRIGEKR